MNIGKVMGKAAKNMKISLKRLVIAFLAAITGLAIFTNKEVSDSTQIAQSQLTVVPAVLPSVAQVTLKNGSSKSGRLTEVDSQKQQLVLTRANQSVSIPTAQIEKVQFFREIRGEIKPLIIKGENREWSNISLSNLRIKDAEKGQVEISLPSEVDPRLDSDRDVIYVIEELSFPETDQVIVSVIVPG